MRLADPVHHVELRPDRVGQTYVVFGFPYRRDLVEAMRGIPGRRFDWDAREWWVPKADAVAPYVRGVVERFPDLLVAPDVEAWLAEAVRGWVGRVSAARYDGRGWFQLETIAGELEEPLAGLAVPRAGCLWVPLSQRAAQALADLPGARLDPRAVRCLEALLVGAEPAPATLLVAHGVGEPRLRLEVNWDPDALRAFLDLPGAERRSHSVPLDPYLVEPLERFLRVHGADVAPTARPTLAALRTEHDDAIEQVRRSRARDAPPLEAEAALGGELRPFQRAGVAYLLAARRAFLADEQGLGKTVQALAALEADGAFPAVVVCPASLKLNWAREIERWLPGRSATVINGTAGTPAPADLTVVNYEIVGAHAPALRRLAPRALVLDESHYVKNPRAKRTREVRRLATALPDDALRLALSGTPVVNHPEELIAQLRILGRLDEFGSGARFKRRFEGVGAEERIHWHLRRRCLVRRLKAEVLPQLPAKRQVAVPVALTNDREYRLAERDVIAWLREQPLDLGELDRRVGAALRAERLAQLNALRRLAARGKTSAALGWIEDFLASGERLVVFATSRELQDAVLARFPDAPHLLGRDGADQRDAAVRLFQEPEGPPLVVCSTRVAGHGITLTRASNVAFLDLEWSPAVHDQAEDRCHRIGQHDAVTAWYLLAASTIDETMLELIARKRGIVGAVTDGRRGEEEAVLDGVVRELHRGGRRHLRVVGG